MTKPLRVSWSAIRSWEECSMKSYLQREGKRAKVSNTRNFFHGTVVDSVMRAWLDDPLQSMPDLVDQHMTDTLAEEKESGHVVRWRDADDRDRVRAFCVELTTRLQPILVKHVLPYPHEHGHWFKIPMSIKDAEGRPRDILLTGEMDLLVEQPQGQVVWDLKGTADDQYYRKVVAQLTFYDIALWASTGRKTYFTGLIQPMCSERLMAWQVTEEARRNLLVRIHRYAHDVWANERSCTDNKQVCHWCDVKHACPRFKPDLSSLGTLADAFRTAAEEAA